MLTMTGDETLAQRAGTGDREAFETLLERHYDRVYRIGHRLLGNPTEAEDLAQDICVGLAKKLRSYRGDSLHHLALSRHR
ncbi:MAG: sigma factor [Alphaproteobacteria bacterium]